MHYGETHLCIYLHMALCFKKWSHPHIQLPLNVCWKWQ